MEPIDLDAIIASVQGKPQPKKRRRSKQQQIPLQQVPALQRKALVGAQFFRPTTLRGMDLFAGAGGFTIGALRSNCPVIGIEYDERAVQAGRGAGHDVLRMDVREAARRAPTAVKMDVMIGGPPCQPFSPAGKRKGRYDPREGFGLAIEAIDAWRPTRAVFENVSEFLASDYIAYRQTVLTALRQRFAYVGVWRLNAKDYGVPQDRERVFVWCAERPLAPPPPTHGPRTGRPYVSVRQALPQLLESGYGYLLAFQGGARSRTMDVPGPTVTTVRNLYAVTEQGMVYRGGGSIPAHKRRILYPAEIQALQAFPPSFGFIGTLAEQARQIGNAVPPPLAAAVTTAVTVDLTPRKITPTELLDSFKTLDESVWVYEPRPWTDEALIGVTTMAPTAPGALVPVYDGRKLKNRVIDAAVVAVAQQHGLSKQAARRMVGSPRTQEVIGTSWVSSSSDPQQIVELPSIQAALDQAIRQQGFVRAMDYLSADKQSRYNPAAPIVVPVHTLKALDLPIATMLLPEKLRITALLDAIKPDVRSQYPRLSEYEVEEAAHDWLADTLADNDEILGF